MTTIAMATTTQECDPLSLTDASVDLKIRKCNALDLSDVIIMINIHFLSTPV